MSGSLEDSDSHRLRALLPAEWWVESQEFNLVHKTVLNLNSLVLDDLLASVPKSMINSSDANGRTPLWWTAHRGDYSAMLSLLRYDVDVCKSSNGGWSALSTALSSKNQQCVRLLLQHSPNLLRHETGGSLPLHQAAYLGLDTDIIEAMLSPGMDINVTTLDSVRSTALMLAAQENHHHSCEYLISLGGDPTIVDALGETALHYALERNAHESILILMRYIDSRLKTKTGATYLHFAAQHSDLESLKILYATDLRGIRTQDMVTSKSPVQILPNVVGLTALEIAKQRTDITPESEWLAMFRRLVHKIDFPDDPAHKAMVDGGVEEFYDALESQEE